MGNVERATRCTILALTIYLVVIQSVNIKIWTLEPLVEKKY